MMTLLLDTHTNKIIIVIFHNREILVKKEIITEYNHSISTMPSLIEALSEANISVHDLEEIICINGPGSFTGVRLGVTIAKTLAYTLNIPIKVISSLLIKAVSFEHDLVNIGELEKNGVFLATFNKDNMLIGDYQYYGKQELENKKLDYIFDVDIDYLKVLDYAKNLKGINPHSVKPLYVKKIEVLK